MQTITRHKRTSDSGKHLKGHRAYQKSPTLTSKLENIYSYSMNTIKKKPYKTGSIILSVGIISSLIFLYRALK